MFTLIACALLLTGTTGVVEGGADSPQTLGLEKADLKCKTEGYKYFEATGSCYKLHKDKRTWDDAAAKCLDEGSHLVVIDNVAEATMITNEMDLAQNFPYTYIGLRDYTGQNDWRSVTGKNISDIYNDWNFGRPSENSGFLCGVIHPEGNIDNYGCNEISTFICESPARIN